METSTIRAHAHPHNRATLTAVKPLAGLRAGSALAWWQEQLVVVQDDAWAIALVDPWRHTVTMRVLKGSGQELPKAEKPDFEAILSLPDGRLALLGPGSARTRQSIVFVDPAGNEADIHDRPDLFLALAKGLGTVPNIEGAVTSHGRVFLFHRGLGSSNAVCDLPLAALFGPAEAMDVRFCDLGQVKGVPLSFTDAALTARGHLVYVAVAEDTSNPIDDGPTLGAAIGVLTETGGYWAPVLEQDGSPTRRKFEGIALNPDQHSAFLVTDADDPTRDAELCLVALAGFW